MDLYKGLLHQITRFQDLDDAENNEFEIDPKFLSIDHWRRQILRGNQLSKTEEALLLLVRPVRHAFATARSALANDRGGRIHTENSEFTEPLPKMAASTNQIRTIQILETPSVTCFAKFFQYSNSWSIYAHINPTEDEFDYKANYCEIYDSNRVWVSGFLDSSSTVFSDWNNEDLSPSEYIDRYGNQKLHVMLTKVSIEPVGDG